MQQIKEEQKQQQTLRELLKRTSEQMSMALVSDQISKQQVQMQPQLNSIVSVSTLNPEPQARLKPCDNTAGNEGLAVGKNGSPQLQLPQTQGLAATWSLTKDLEAQQAVKLGAQQLNSDVPVSTLDREPRAKLKKKKKIAPCENMTENNGLAVRNKRSNEREETPACCDDEPKTKKANCGDSVESSSQFYTMSPEQKRIYFDFVDNDSICRQNQANEPQAKLGNLLAKIFDKEHKAPSDLKHHFGLQALIREWFACALAKRSLNLLAKASNFALMFGISMDRILSGVDEVGLEEAKDVVDRKGSTESADENVKECIGEKMTYLLTTFLEPRSVQIRNEEHGTMLNPVLPASLFSYISPQTCSSFQELSIRNRWILICETCRGVTKFYCSPMFEQNVLRWVDISRIDEALDIFSVIFAGEQFDMFLDCLAKQVSLHDVDGNVVRPIYSSTNIRLLSKYWGVRAGDDEAPSSMGKLKEALLDKSMPTINVKMMYASMQTMDKHLVSNYSCAVTIFYDIEISYIF
jgi:hypothetical protein